MIMLVALAMVFTSLGVVGWPLFRGTSGRGSPRRVEDTKVSEMLAQKDATLLAISELEADYDMGNLSQNDYHELRKRYDEKAVALLKTTHELLGERGLDATSRFEEEIEARVSELRSRKSVAAGTSRSCSSCEAKVQPGDVFCFQCGAVLSLKCPSCSASVNRQDRFCARCGTELGNNGSQ